MRRNIIQIGHPALKKKNKRIIDFSSTKIRGAENYQVFMFSHYV